MSLNLDGTWCENLCLIPDAFVQISGPILDVCRLVLLDFLVALIISPMGHWSSRLSTVWQR